MHHRDRAFGHQPQPKHQPGQNPRAPGSVLRRQPDETEREHGPQCEHLVEHDQRAVQHEGGERGQQNET